MAIMSIQLKNVIFVGILILFMGNVMGVKREVVSPEKLKRELETAESKIKESLLNAILQIRTSVTILEVIADDVKENFGIALESAAKGYWSIIRKLRSAAAEVGRDISDCIATGNAQLYALNTRLTTVVADKVDLTVSQGREEAAENIADARSTLSRLRKISDKISDCNDLMCATVLEEELLEFYIRAKDTIDTALSEMIDFRTASIVNKLSGRQIDNEVYEDTYKTYVKNITDCIKSDYY